MPDNLGGLVPWMKLTHRNNFDVKAVPHLPLHNLTTEKISRKHVLEPNADGPEHLWHSGPGGGYVIQLHNQEVKQMACGEVGGKSYTATVYMTDSFQADTLVVKLSV